MADNGKDMELGATVYLRGLSLAYGTIKVLNGIDLDVEHGKVNIIVGPSGCGKSSLLRAIAGITPPQVVGLLEQSGTNAESSDQPQIPVAFVFQRSSLYPHMTVIENIAAPLIARRVRAEPLWRKAVHSLRLPKPNASEREHAIQACTQMGVENLAGRFPHQLSGGEAQRVAIARCIAMREHVELILMDEPLNNVDPRLKDGIKRDLLEFQRDTDSTIVYVTHDHQEAIELADRIIVMDDHGIAQSGAPAEILREPDNLFVARFFGNERLNFFELSVDKDRTRFSVPLSGQVRERHPVWKSTIPLPESGVIAALPAASILAVQSEDHAHSQAFEAQTVFPSGDGFTGRTASFDFHIPRSVFVEGERTYNLRVVTPPSHIFEQDGGRRLEAEFSIDQASI